MDIPDGPVTPPTPISPETMRGPNQFQGGPLSVGHQTVDGQQSAELRNPIGRPVRASDFMRSYLQDGHQDRSPASTDIRVPVTPEQYWSERMGRQADDASARPASGGRVDSKDDSSLERVSFDSGDVSPAIGADQVDTLTKGTAIPVSVYFAGEEG